MRFERGFALIEVLIAGFLLMLVVLGVAGVAIMATGHLERSGEQTTAVSLAQQRVEWLRNQGYDSTAMIQGVSTELLTGQYQGYTRVTTVVDDTPRAGVKQISVMTTTPRGTTSQVLALVAEP